MKQFLLALTILTPMSLMAAIDREWGPQSNPTIRSKTFVYEFSSLPLSGAPSFRTRLWSGDSWPTRNGLINQRWNTPEHQGFKLVSPTREEALSMSEEEISKLAPSEKFDLLNGDYEYSLVKEVAARAYQGAPVWYGICHGWAPASDSARGTVKRVRVKTQMRYVKESTVNTWLPVFGTVNQITAVEKYEYVLDLDKKGKIIGGEWISKHRPDFLWSMDRAVKFPGMYARLSELAD